jgi:hypothetical protein
MSAYDQSHKTMRRSFVTAVVISLVFGFGAVQAAVQAAAAPPAPVKLVLREQISHEFAHPEGVDGSEGNDVYISDRENRRIQEFEADGKFVLMFGTEVNATTKGNICTAASGDTCKTGVAGTGPGQIYESVDVAVAPESAGGDVYLAEEVFGAERVQKFTSTGEFVLEIGKEVNKTGGNLCTATEIADCQAPAPSTGAEHGSLEFLQNAGNVLAVGGPNETIYLGERERVQEFTLGGVWKGEIALSSLAAGTSVRAMALEQATGDLYLSYGTATDSSEGTIRQFTSTGTEAAHFTVPPQHGREMVIDGLAFDGQGRLAMLAVEKPPASGEISRQFGRLYEAAGGHQISEFAVPQDADVTGIGFDGAGELFAAATVAESMLVYAPVDVAELHVAAQACAPGVEHGTDATVDCTFNGEANPESVAATEVWFQWGEACSSLSFETSPQSLLAVSELLSVDAVIEGLKPNGHEFCYRLAGFDQNVEAPEASLTSADPETVRFTTPIVPVQIVGAPSVSHVRDTAAVLSAELNPENAPTEYYFEYSPQTGALENCPQGIIQARNENAECPGVVATPAGSSALYGQTSTSLEARRLQPETSYQYRLFAEDQNSSGTEKSTTIGAVGSFTTGPAPHVSAAAGSASSIEATSAVVSGTVNGGGQPASYTIELGVDNGPLTQYATVFAGSTDGETAEVESIPLTGLQPATTYAYRLALSSGYVQNEQHTLYTTPVAFTTQGIAAVLTPPSILPQLPVPAITFPAQPAGKSKHLTRAQKLAAALKACHSKPRSRRAACEHAAHKKYPASKANSKKRGKS